MDAKVVPPCAPAETADRGPRRFTKILPLFNENAIVRPCRKLHNIVRSCREVTHMMSILDYFDYLNNIVVWSVVAVFAAAGLICDWVKTRKTRQTNKEG